MPNEELILGLYNTIKFLHAAVKILATDNSEGARVRFIELKKQYRACVEKITALERDDLELLFALGKSEEEDPIRFVREIEQILFACAKTKILIIEEQEEVYAKLEKLIENIEKLKRNPISPKDFVDKLSLLNSAHKMIQPKLRSLNKIKPHELYIKNGKNIFQLDAEVEARLIDLNNNKVECMRIGAFIDRQKSLIAKLNSLINDAIKLLKSPCSDKHFDETLASLSAKQAECFEEFAAMNKLFDPENLTQEFIKDFEDFNAKFLQLMNRFIEQLDFLTENKVKIKEINTVETLELIKFLYGKFEDLLSALNELLKDSPIKLYISNYEYCFILDSLKNSYMQANKLYSSMFRTITSINDIESFNAIANNINKTISYLYMRTTSSQAELEKLFSKLNKLKASTYELKRSPITPEYFTAKLKKLALKYAKISFEFNKLTLSSQKAEIDPSIKKTLREMLESIKKNIAYLTANKENILSSITETPATLLSQDIRDLMKKHEECEDTRNSLELYLLNQNSAVLTNNELLQYANSLVKAAQDKIYSSSCRLQHKFKLFSLKHPERHIESYQEYISLVRKVLNDINKLMSLINAPKTTTQSRLNTLESDCFFTPTSSPFGRPPSPTKNFDTYEIELLTLAEMGVRRKR